LSGAVVEYRFVVHRWPRVGDLIEVRSGVTEIGRKTQRMIHWVLDPASGDAWGSAEVVAIAFDLNTRKSVDLNDRQRARFETRLVPGMTI
jgi:acyl-CoA thioester hydrolase